MGEMTAIAIREPGGPEVLVTARIAVPVPGPGQLLVRVKAAGVNRPDVLQRQGGYPPPPGAPLTPGLEIAGEVTGLGQGVRRYEVGDRVCGLVPGGGYAEYAVVHEDNALPVPAGFSMEEAAGIPETFFTVWTNVFDRGGLAPGETLLIHGGSSGIGTTAIMLAKALGSTVVVTAGSDEKCAACVKLGADHAQAADADRLDTPSTECRREGGNRACAGVNRLSSVRGGAVQAGHLPQLRAGRRGQGACADGFGRACGEDRASDLN